MAEKTTRRGEVTESFRHLQRAVALAPGLQEAHNNLGASLVKNGQLEAERWLESLKGRTGR